MTLRQSQLAFALEHSLGHVTHAQNLKQRVLEDARINPLFVDLLFRQPGTIWERLPVVKSNWTLRASLQAFLALRSLARGMDALLFHTQVTALFATGLMRQTPSVVSLDATPLQIDALGAWYGHAPAGGGRVEHTKKRLQENVFRSARQLVTWSEWAKSSLVADYSVPGEKVTVIPPGVDCERWRPVARPVPGTSMGAKVRVLFVGKDFRRKGGDLLLEALAGLPGRMRGRIHADIVTGDEGASDAPGITFHRGLTPNSDTLRRLYREADLFVFPTRADCLPLAILEALASGLPVVSTAVGAIPEAVVHGQNGIIVPPEDASALQEALVVLANDAALRERMGTAAREKALAQFDALQNYRRLVETVESAGK